MKINVQTSFDCTPTGVTGHMQHGKMPFTDRSGTLVDSELAWHHARNKQRNWETLLQIISLRAQPINITDPLCKDKTWSFDFEVESAGVYSVNEDPNNIDSLYTDCAGVPMMTKLDEAEGTVPELVPQENIWFKAVNTESGQ